MTRISLASRSSLLTSRTSCLLIVSTNLLSTFQVPRCRVCWNNILCDYVVTNVCPRTRKTKSTAHLARRIKDLHANVVRRRSRERSRASMLNTTPRLLASLYIRTKGSIVRNRLDSQCTSCRWLSDTIRRSSGFCFCDHKKHNHYSVYWITTNVRRCVFTYFPRRNSGDGFVEAIQPIPKASLATCRGLLKIGDAKYELVSCELTAVDHLTHGPRMPAVKYRTSVQFNGR